MNIECVVLSQLTPTSKNEINKFIKNNMKKSFFRIKIVQLGKYQLSRFYYNDLIISYII